MDIFLIVLLIFLVMAVLGKIPWLVKDEFPERTWSEEMGNVLINIVFIVWAINKLVTVT